MQVLKPGTKIETVVGPFAARLGVTPERAIIQQPQKGFSLPYDHGYYPVKFESGGVLCLHTSHFRVLDPD